MSKRFLNKSLVWLRIPGPGQQLQRK